MRFGSAMGILGSSSSVSPPSQSSEPLGNDLRVPGRKSSTRGSRCSAQRHAVLFVPGLSNVPKVSRVERTEARPYLAKAQQFVAEARSGLQSGRADAALLCAIHAAISAADAVTVALAGQRSADPNHLAAADLLRSVG